MTSIALVAAITICLNTMTTQPDYTQCVDRAIAAEDLRLKLDVVTMVDPVVVLRGRP